MITKDEAAKLYREGKINRKQALEAGVDMATVGGVGRFDYVPEVGQAHVTRAIVKTIESVKHQVQNEVSVVHARRAAKSQITHIYRAGKVPLSALENLVGQYTFKNADHSAYLSNIPDADLGAAITILAGAGVELSGLKVTKGGKAPAIEQPKAGPKGDATRVVPVTPAKPKTEGDLACDSGLASIAARKAKFEAGMKKGATELDLSALTPEQRAMICQALGIEVTKEKSKIVIK